MMPTQHLMSVNVCKDPMKCLLFIALPMLYKIVGTWNVCACQCNGLLVSFWLFTNHLHNDDQVVEVGRPDSPSYSARVLQSHTPATPQQDREM